MTAAAPPSLAGLHGAGQRRPLYSRLPALYFATPPWARSLARWLVGSRNGGLDLVGGYLARLEGWPAGDGRPVPLLLTHDVDTPEGYRTLPRLLEAEEALGLASLSLMVTHRYAWEPARLAALAERGHRFGVHDTTHDNRLAYLPPAEVSARIRRAQQALGPLDAGAFRAPAFLRTRGLYEGIAPVVRVDLSAIDWALLWPHPGDGMGSPFPVRYGPMTCVPTTLPHPLARRGTAGRRPRLHRAGPPPRRRGARRPIRRPLPLLRLSPKGHRLRLPLLVPIQLPLSRNHRAALGAGPNEKTRWPTLHGCGR